jgi:hypothetical protein
MVSRAWGITRSGLKIKAIWIQRFTVPRSPFRLERFKSLLELLNPEPICLLFAI